MKKAVYIVGAGPGDQSLITVKGLAIIQAADFIVYDHLVDLALLNHRPLHCQTLYVGKQAGLHAKTQDEINQLLVDLAARYQVVVRLKGGDPFVFGRGSEEAAYLNQYGVPFVVVPGVTSAIGALAALGIPVTARGMANSFHVFTGHSAPQQEEPNYRAAAKLGGTLVFLMGVSNLSYIVKELRTGGLKSSTPAAIVYKGTWPDQACYVGTIGNIEEVAQEARVQAPSILVVGDVVQVRQDLSQADTGPLAGIKVVITRGQDKQASFAQGLMDLDAQVIQVPTLQIKALYDASDSEILKDLSQFQGLIFKSAASVDVFFEKIGHLRLDSRCLYALRIIAIGSETAKRLKTYGILADGHPRHFDQGSLARYLVDQNCHWQVKHYLMPSSAQGNSKDLEDILSQKGIKLKTWVCYKTQTNEGALFDARYVINAHYLTFTSASTVHALMALLQGVGIDIDRDLNQSSCIAIGRQTAKAIESYGLKVTAIANPSTTQGIIEAILQHRQAGVLHV